MVKNLGNIIIIKPIRRTTSSNRDLIGNIGQNKSKQNTEKWTHLIAGIDLRPNQSREQR